MGDSLKNACQHRHLQIPAVRRREGQCGGRSRTGRGRQASPWSERHRRGARSGLEDWSSLLWVWGPEPDQPQGGRGRCGVEDLGTVGPSAGSVPVYEASEEIRPLRWGSAPLASSVTSKRQIQGQGGSRTPEPLGCRPHAHSWGPGCLVASGVALRESWVLGVP